MTSLFDRYLQESDAFSAKNKTPELSRAQRCFKTTLVAFNVLFLIFACVLMGVGSVAYNHNVGPLVGSTIPVGIIVLGVFIMFLSFIGCIGAYRESRMFLGCYFLFLLLFTVLLLAVGIGVYAKREEAGAYIEQGWRGASNDVRVSFQNGFQCCGLFTYNDTLAGSPCPTGNITQGCDNILISTFNNSYNTMGAVGVAFAILMLIGMCFVCVLMRTIRARAERGDSENLHSGEDSSNPAVAASVDTSV